MVRGMQHLEPEHWHEKPEKPAEKPIETDRSCAECGYNLRGLTPGNKCPECGTAIPGEHDPGPSDELLGEGDPKSRRSWQIGLGLAAGCVAFSFVSRWIVSLLAIFILGKRPDVYHFIMILCSIIWVVAVWMITPKTLDVQWPRLRPLRWGVRITQIFWPLALTVHAIALTANLSQTQEDWLLLFQLWGRLLAGMGVIGLAWQMHMIADRAQCSKAASRMLIAAWVMPFFAILLMLFPSTMAWITLTLLMFVLFFWTWTMVLFAMGLWELSSHAGWSLKRTHDQVDRERRITEKRHEMVKEVDSRVRPVSPDPDPEIHLE